MFIALSPALFGDMYWLVMWRKHVSRHYNAQNCFPYRIYCPLSTIFVAVSISHSSPPELQGHLYSRIKGIQFVQILFKERVIPFQNGDNDYILSFKLLPEWSKVWLWYSGSFAQACLLLGTTYSGDWYGQCTSCSGHLIKSLG